MSFDKAMMWLRRILTAGAALAMLSIAAPGYAQASCTISTSAVSFGTYNVFGTNPVDSTGAVTYRCNSSAFNITVKLSRGQSSTYTPRTMLKTAEALTYNLYLDAARTTIWGDGTGGTQFYSRANPPNNSNVVLTVYGRVTAAQDVSAGTYTDTIAATINF